MSELDKVIAKAKKEGVNYQSCGVDISCIHQKIEEHRKIQQQLTIMNSFNKEMKEKERSPNLK